MSRYERNPKRSPNHIHLRALKWLRLVSGSTSSAALWRTTWPYFSPKESARLKRGLRQTSGWEEETGAQWSPSHSRASQSAQPASEQSEMDERRRSRTALGRDGSTASHSWHTRSTVPIIANLSAAVTRTSSQCPRYSLAWTALFEMRIYKENANQICTWTSLLQQNWLHSVV